MALSPALTGLVIHRRSPTQSRPWKQSRGFARTNFETPGGEGGLHYLDYPLTCSLGDIVNNSTRIDLAVGWQPLASGLADLPLAAAVGAVV